MSAARIDSAGRAYPLDGKSGPRQVVSSEDVTDPVKLAETLTRMLADVAGLTRAFVPSRVDFEDMTVLAAGGTLTLHHGYGGRVRWMLIGCSVNITSIAETAATTADDLVLSVTSSANGVATFRVEATG